MQYTTVVEHEAARSNCNFSCRWCKVFNVGDIISSARILHITELLQSVLMHHNNRSINQPAGTGLTVAQSWFYISIDTGNSYASLIKHQAQQCSHLLRCSELMKCTLYSRRRWINSWNTWNSLRNIRFRIMCIRR